MDFYRKNVQSNTSKKDLALSASSRNSPLDILLFSEDASIQNQIESKLDEYWKLENVGIKETIIETTDDSIEQFQRHVQKEIMENFT